MKNNIIVPILAASALVITGCGTDAHYVQTGGTQNIVNVGQINIQDYIQAANSATSDLLASGALDKVPNPPAVLYISRIVNNTGQQIDTDLLTKKISIALLNSGKAVTTSTDPAAKGYQQENEFMGDKKPQKLPDFTLSGKIIQLNARTGNTSQATYSFQLSLNDTRNSYQVWEGEKEITKQGTRGGIGF
jgi:hypothetical protein